MIAEELTRFGIDSTRNTCTHPWAYAKEMLQRVSRTFALNIRVLPGVRLGRPILLAYLFCRMADTVEDSPHLPAQEKVRLLELFARIFSHTQFSWHDAAAAFVTALPSSWLQSEDDEEFLCAHCAWVIDLYFALPKKVQMPIEQCVREMCDGMGRFALRQESQAGQWLTIEDEADLDQYCYFVAGVVGNMLCDLFYAQSPFINNARHQRMRQLAVSFGLGLQLVNIIKDAMEDSVRNVCFIPMEWLREEGFMHPAELFSAQADEGARQRVMHKIISKAWRHLQDALDYTVLIPALEPRLRLFCQWPMLMAAETLTGAGNGTVLFKPDQKLKISRADVKRIIRQSSMWCWTNSWIKRRFAALSSTKTAQQ
ncbi:phytoene/squalene synthase family protein [Uliginosibacterium gangwonense]|uniref:phytoene/squalene synthase family protein n=1 Tax=Uliginosibacterium gangwonense TaxID=392736 RepID=UPI0003700FA7|nr:phytoene/squalene synthase family protein [Uliginosibacterium gangwonense]